MNQRGPDNFLPLNKYAYSEVRKGLPQVTHNDIKYYKTREDGTRDEGVDINTEQKEVIEDQKKISRLPRKLVKPVVLEFRFRYPNN